MEYFRDKFKSIFKVKESPHRIALAFALGVFMGISPFIGLHYIGGFFMAWLFRLNKLIAMIGVSVNNPWTIVPLSTFCVWLGAKMLGMDRVLPEIDWEQVSLMSIMGKFTDMESFTYTVNQLLPLIKAFFVGSLVICTLSALSSYFIIKVVATKYHRI